jgi:hypothetical protein
MTPALSLDDFARRLHLALQRPSDLSASEFEEAALELHALQFEHNRAYRQLCCARGRHPRDLRQWQEIPPVPAAAFKECELTSLAPAERRTVFHSSGTTAQEPSRHFHSAHSLALYEASLLRGFFLHGAPEPDPVAAGCGGPLRVRPEAGPHLVWLTPSAAEAPCSSWAYMLATIAGRVPNARVTWAGRVAADGSWTLDFPRVRSALDHAVASGAAVMLAGTAFNHVHLLEAMAEAEVVWSLGRGSWALETGGYKGRSRELPKAELHTGLAERLGLPRARIICEYGMSELSSQAYDTAGLRAAGVGAEAGPRRFEFPPWARCRVVSPETGEEVGEGETGRLRLWDLANVWSVQAVQTEDLAVRRGEGFELLGRAAQAEPRGCSLMAR